VVVLAMGNEYRRDDGAGVAVTDLVAERLADGEGAGGDATVSGPFGDPLDLLGEWDGATLAVVVDAVRTGAAPGTVTVVELGDHTSERPTGSTHTVGVAAALRLARAVDRAPRRVVAVGIEGEDFGDGIGLSDAVASSVEEAASRVLDVVAGSAPCA
jgi:hydrogenase maturation protease